MDGSGQEPYPMTARVLLMEGEEGGVAVASRLRPELEGGDVEGTVRLTTGESSPSPVENKPCQPEAATPGLLVAGSQVLSCWAPGFSIFLPQGEAPSSCSSCFSAQPRPLASWFREQPHPREAKEPGIPVVEGESSTRPTFTTCRKEGHVRSSMETGEQIQLQTDGQQHSLYHTTFFFSWRQGHTI